MWYNDLRPEEELPSGRYALVFTQDDLKLTEAGKKRTLENLITLKSGIASEVPQKQTDRNILLASWNIKEFGHLQERLPESYYYIAEIINAFDIIAIQEIKTSLFDLNIVMKILGSHWSYLITDITEGTGGNRERFGFVYDTRRVQHSGLSGELVISPEMADTAEHLRQLKRTPSITGFEAGWKKFSVVGSHLHPGNDTDDQAIRKEEVNLLLGILQEKLDNNGLWNENLVILGDTNLYSNNTDIVDLFVNGGYQECDGLLGKPTNASLTETYDRIFMRTDRYFKLLKDDNGVENGGVFKLYDYVFTAAQRPSYHVFMLAHKNDPSTLDDDQAFDDYYHRYWKRNQISDHLPVWIEIESDSSRDFLKSKKDRFS